MRPLTPDIITGEWGLRGPKRGCLCALQRDCSWPGYKPGRHTRGCRDGWWADHAEWWLRPLHHGNLRVTMLTAHLYNPCDIPDLASLAPLRIAVLPPEHSWYNPGSSHLVVVWGIALELLIDDVEAHTGPPLQYTRPTPPVQNPLRNPGTPPQLVLHRRQDLEPTTGGPDLDPAA